MKITRRLLALLLALCLTFGNVMPAMATELATDETKTVEEAQYETQEATEPVVSGTVGIEDNPFAAEDTEPQVTEPEVTEAPAATPSTPAEIVEAAYALGEGESLEGTYTLTGTIVAITEAYNATYGNITVTMTVEGCEDKPIVCYRMTGTGVDQLAKNDVITVTGTLTNYYGTIEFTSGCTLDSYVKGEPEEEVTGTTYTFSNYTAGVQYAENEEHVLDDVVTVITNQAHFTTQIRLYDSSSNDGTAVIKSTKYIDAIVLNAGYKAATLNVYGSADGETWELITGLTTTTAYLDHTVDVPDGYNYLKLDAVGDQVRVASMTIAFGDVVPVPGTEDYPEQITFTPNEDGTSTATVTVPANTTYYVSFTTGMGYMSSDMVLTIDGEEYGIVNGSFFQPEVVALTNDTDAERTFTLVLSYPLGSQMNPDTVNVYIEDESEDEWTGFNQTWVEPGDMDGYLFSWTAPADGELTITMENGAAGWAYSIYNLDTYVSTEYHYSCDIPNVNSETIEVNAGDRIQIMVNSCGPDTSTIPGGNIMFFASFMKYIGSAQNPYEIDGDWNWNSDYTGATASVTVAANSTYYIRTWMNGKQLSINGGEATTLTDPEFDGIIVPLANETDAEMVFELALTVPEYEPELGTWGNPAELVAGENVGTVTENSWTGYLFSYIAPANGSMTINFSAEDATGAACGWSYQINNLTAWVYGDTMDSTIEGAETATVTFNKGDEIQISVNTFDPNSWDTPAGSIKLNVSFELAAVGTAGNPMDLEAGYHTVELPEGVTGYYYGYKATEAGTLAVSVTNGNYESVTFTVNGETANEVSVKKDDYVLIYVECAGPATLNIALYFTAEPGSINNPIMGWDPMMEEVHSIDPYKTVYFAARNVGGSNLYVMARGTDMVLELDGVTYDLPAYEYIEIAIPDSGMGFFAPPTVFSVTNYNWESAQEVSYFFGYDPGHQSNPDEMILGKNTATVEAGTQGYYYNWIATGSGFLEVTMNTKTGWFYQIYNKTTYAQESHWSDETPVPTKGYLAVNEGDTIEVVVNTYDPENPYSAPAGDIAFTAKLIKSYNSGLASGKSMTLKYINPTNGKTVSNSKVKWEMFMYQLDEFGNKVMDENWQYVTIPVPTEVATLKAGKLTATAGVTESTQIIVKGVYGETENIYNITVYPAPTAIEIGAMIHGAGSAEPEILNNVNGQTLTYDLAKQVIELGAIVNPEEALQDVTWTSSNTKVLTIEEEDNGTVVLWPVINAKTQKVGTGTVTITATAKDGSGIKASVKVKVTCSAVVINVYSKNGQTVIGSGKSLTMAANVPYAVNKAVTWDVKVLNVAEDFDHASIATISSKGVLTAKKGLTETYTVEVSATAKDGSGVVGTTEIVIAPVATKVVIDAPATHDLSGGYETAISATALSMSGEQELYSTTDVKWTTSNKAIATVVYVEEYSYEIWDYVLVPVVQFTGKTGKVTLTATATDGSKVNAKVTINVIRSPEELSLSKYDAVLAVGKTMTLKATVGPTNVTNKAVTWSAKALTMDPFTSEYVELSENIGLSIKNGKVSVNTKKVNALVAEGGDYPVIEVTATAKMPTINGEYLSETCWIQLCAATTKVNIIRYGNIVTGKTLTMDDNATMVLGYDYIPSDAGYYYTWKSSNTKVATVTENWDGTVTVKPTGKLGTVTITATAADGTNKSAKVTVKVVRKVDDLAIDTSAFVLSGKAKGNSFDLNKLLTVYPSNASNKKVTWTIADWSKQLAADNNITLKGSKLTVKKNVSAPINLYVVAKAADGFGASRTAMITITPAVAGINICVHDVPVTDVQLLDIGEMLKVTAVATNEGAANQFTWKSSNTKVAKIVVEGGEVYVVGVKAGTAKITATAKDGSGKSATITVKVLPDKA